MSPAVSPLPFFPHIATRECLPSCVAFPCLHLAGRAGGLQLWGATVVGGPTVFNGHTARKMKTGAEGSRESKSGKEWSW